MGDNLGSCLFPQGDLQEKIAMRRDPGSLYLKGLVLKTRPAEAGALP